MTWNATMRLLAGLVLTFGVTACSDSGESEPVEPEMTTGVEIEEVPARDVAKVAPSENDMPADDGEVPDPVAQTGG